MPTFEAVRMAFATIWSQKLKSFFSLIGVLIGVTFLIAVVSIVQGMNVYMEEKFANTLVGLNTFQLRQRPGIQTGNVSREVSRAWRRRPRLSYADADYVLDRLTVPVTTARISNKRLALAYGGKQAKDINLTATESAFFRIKKYNFSAGRPFTAQEVRSGVPVAVIGDLVAEKLFVGADPLGKQVVIGGLPYRVIGVVEKQGTLFGLPLDKFAVVPWTSPAQRLVNPINILNELSIQTADEPSMRAAMAEVEGIMRVRRQLKPSQASNFTLQTADGALDSWGKISAILFTALPGLVAISLVVGGIVIMNIMLMAVSERTREIGVRKALGAKRRDILAQFVVESTTLSVLGAALGVGFGILLAFVIKAVTPLPAAVAPWSIAVGVLLGVLVGITAGVYPASQASKLDPITALRSE